MSTSVAAFLFLLAGLLASAMRFHCACCRRQYNEDIAEKKNMKNTGYNCLKTFPCRYCGCELIGDETHGSCCNKGKTPGILRRKRPNFFDVIDDDLLPLYTTNNKEFENNTRKYNSLFCFSSMGTTGIGGFDTYDGHRINGGNVCVNGRTYHRIFHANDATDRQKNNPMKWYLIDPLDRQRSAQDSNLDMHIYTSLNDYILNHNQTPMGHRTLVPSTRV